MKTLKHFFMLNIFCMISLGASAEVYYGWCGDNAQWTLDTETGLLSITGSGNMTNYDYYSHAPWYDHGRSVISLSIGDNITSIGDWAFWGCSNMTSATIPNFVISIGKEAFSSCSSLTSVTIGNSVTSIGDYAFYECSGLTSMIIGNSVTSIGSSAFSGCSGLTSVTIPNSVTSIGYEAFSGCGNVKELIYAEGTKIVLRTYLTSITSVTIPNSVTEIGNSAFYNCSALTSVTIPNSVTSIGDDAFWGCKGLTSVTIPNSVTSIGDYAFWYCSGLTSVIIPNSVTSIGSSAFAFCLGLTSVIIPNSVTSIGSYAFDNCTSLPIENNLRYADTYLIEAVDKTLSTYTIKEGTKWIGSTAFYECSGLTSVTIPNSVTSIGDYAFWYCLGLISVSIPNSVTNIGWGAFEGCSGLTSVKVYWKRPLSMYASVWSKVNKQKCTLHVPEGTCELYRGAPVWMDFVNIEEFSEEPGEEIYLTVMGVNGVILQQAVEMGETYKYLLDNKKNGKIVSVTFNGEDVTADVTDGKYTTPKITGNSEIYVEYDNQPLGDTNLDGNVNVNDITKTAEIILLRAKAEMEAKAAMEAVSEP